VTSDGDRPSTGAVVKKNTTAPHVRDETIAARAAQTNQLGS
jgi:hypothetical protein